MIKTTDDGTALLTARNYWPLSALARKVKRESSSDGCRRDTNSKLKTGPMSCRLSPYDGNINAVYVDPDRKASWPPGKRQTLLHNAAINDKLIGPVFSFELVVARLQPSEDDSLVTLRANADRGQ